ncbi:U11/U12 small nuclear ribonucleoprotein 25 kDa protein [Arachis stenosperma]|uniref:U11/U12 small nuclear ribonucleoprotein 25 kDa protein n=1 Tax=Arachis stenosperma TaxID=217475 RepID=UPI0025ABBC13|nr:U11/U12 small nuclear ribonucleoprotein 25 kDa protein [Arachis stenosperma]XP_057752187.1 U11/U12 small nuclear ribonucleoprotein 25 kDa protein [Arachis stenosperma]XP_057752188.1 U11/U12 small nuclear ribonucleoprotein 25 kDa protein [Arachis stenosperma]XP_057752189.1 U11/U12 small nuclear ribonucleoprotein 25 kDa protein [Arachis stenosperma]XP_057752190.1 U11/U12 small nuclear ribonucleoprotein 25 kDa protein [Arachis stenosperma]XP_057752191.1 U11/U12 small nuclear ribonucleoprotein 
MDAEGSSQSQLKIPDAAARESSNSSAPSNQIDVGEYEYNEGGLKKAKLQSMLRVLLDDPLLSDVPKNPTLADVDTLLSLELGSAMRLSVLKLDGTSFEVTVMNSATVKDLKLAIKKKVNDMEQSGLGHRHISWKHVWANYCLAYHNNKLLHDDDLLQNFGIRNNSQVHFVSFVMTKESRRHSKRRKHRFFHGLNKLSHEKNCED